MHETKKCIHPASQIYVVELAWAGCKILEINGLWASPSWKIWRNPFLSHMRFSVVNYQLFPAHQHNYQENITKYVKVSCFCSFFSQICAW